MNHQEPANNVIKAPVHIGSIDYKRIMKEQK